MSPSPGSRKRLLLTGASGKFGAKFIELFADHFDIVAVTNTRSTAAATQASSVFDAVNETHKPKQVIEVKCDLRDDERIAACVNAIVDLAGPVTYLVNAAADVRFLGSTFDASYFRQQAAQHEQRVEALRLQLLRGAQHVVERLAGHEAGDGAAHERRAHALLT